MSQNPARTKARNVEITCADSSTSEGTAGVRARAPVKELVGNGAPAKSTIRRRGASGPKTRSRRAGVASPAACTIIARNYLSHARILARSYLDHHPDGRFYLLVVDGLPEGVDVGVEGVHVVTSAELQLPCYYEMCFKYDVTELSTAVKPSLLALLMSRFDEKRVLYLDPDILVLQPLTEIVRAFDHSSVVLTPHLSKPIPNDGLAPSEQDILIAGAYNLGFIGLARTQETAELLSWWEDRLRDLCRADPRQGLMVDQRWIDLVPTLFPNTYLLKDETYNVAYWNLHSRQLEKSNATFTINGRPLTFFHFSGFNPLRPRVLSKHQTRHQVASGSALAELLAHYASLQLQEGYEEAMSWSYGLNEFDNGVGLHGLARRLYLDLDEETRARFGDPFASEGADSFFAWATRETEGGRRLSPFQEAIYRARYDVACAFPDVGGADRDRFIEWATTQGAGEMGYAPALITGRAALTRRRGGSPRLALDGLSGPLPEGVNVCGYIRNESGLGTHVRGLIDSLSRMGVDYALKDVSSLSVNRSDDTSVTEFDETHPHPVNLVCINADQHFVVMSQDKSFFDARYNVGIWNWELPSFPPEWYDRFDHYDEIWAGSSMIVNALAPVSPIPVVRIPPVLFAKDVAGREARRREMGRRALRLASDETMYLFMFDFHSYFERKNPLAAIRAFKQAFREGERARLVLKCLNGQSDEVSLRRLVDEAAGYPVDILTEYVSRERVAQVLAASDVYVSLHRSEGIGLTIGEAMALAKPVIATAWSGNTDFMDVSNSFPIDFELVELEHDVGPYRAGQVWAEPSVEHAATVMRELFDSPELGAARGRLAQQHVRRYYSPERVARSVAERLAIVEQRRKVVARREYRLPPAQQGIHGNLDAGARLVALHVPRGSTVAVVSRGDPELLNLAGCTGWHFPQTENGTYAGYHPADSSVAVGHLEALVAKGAEYLLVPASSGWWLEHYAEFRQHLEGRHQLIETGTAGSLYRLYSPLGGASLAPDPTGNTQGKLRDEEPSSGALLGTSFLLAHLYAALTNDIRHRFDEPTWPEEFLEWATRTTVEASGLSPFLDLLYRLRPDVAAAFPDLHAAHREAFLAWAGSQGAVEMGYDPNLAAPSAPRTNSFESERAPRSPDGHHVGSEGDDAPVEVTLRLLVDAEGGVPRVRVVPTTNGVHP